MGKNNKLIVFAAATATLMVLPFATTSIRSINDFRTPWRHASAVAAESSLILGHASHGLTDAELREIKVAGATYVRTDFAMSRVQPISSESFDWRDLEWKVAAATAHGLKVLGILDYSPQWNAHPGCIAGSPYQCAPAAVAAFADFAAAAAVHFPEVTHWEIWNEPNLAQLWDPAPNPDDYIKLLNTAYMAIKNAAPNDVILAGALSRANNIHGVEIAPPSFVASMYAGGAKFDILSFHPYTYPFSPESTSAGNGWHDVAAIRRTMVANGDTEKKVWITEVGVPTCGLGKRSAVDAQPFTKGDYMTETAQQAILSRVLDDTRLATFVEALFVYEIRDDNSNDASTRENCVGLIHSDDTPEACIQGF